MVTLWFLLACSLSSENRQWFPSQFGSFAYPRLALQAQISGCVRLRVALDSSGSVSSVTGLSGHPLLVEVGTRNVKEWRFTRIDALSGPEPQEIDFVVLFRLQGETRDTPRWRFEYQHPYRVTIVSEAPLWTP